MEKVYMLSINITKLVIRKRDLKIVLLEMANSEIY